MIAFATLLDSLMIGPVLLALLAITAVAAAPARAHHSALTVQQQVFEQFL